jgi:hypothetical protein
VSLNLPAPDAEVFGSNYPPSEFQPPWYIFLKDFFRRVIKDMSSTILAARLLSLEDD